MATAILKLGPRDHGKALSYDDFMAADYRPCYKYELIDGRLFVSPQPNPPEDYLLVWIQQKLFLYMLAHTAVINHVSPKPRVFVPGRERTTCPEPDLAAYHDYPRHLPKRRIRWEKLSPILVVEVLTDGDASKDLVRNVELYLLVPTIKEYWVVDGREDPDKPTLRVHRRRGRKWQIMEVAYGEVYTTNLLPEFELKIDPAS